MSIKIGITGHSGSLGKEIVKSKFGFNYSFFKGDIRSKSKVLKWIDGEKFDAIIHLAAIVPIRIVNNNQKKAYNVNYLGTKNIVDVVKKKKINERSEIKPISYYGQTKLLAENYIIKKLKDSDTTYCIGRIFSTTNKSQKNNYLVPDLKRKIKKTDKKIILYNLDHYRDFISMKDISKIIFHLYKKKFNGIINIASGRGIHLKDIARFISKYYKKQIEFVDNIEKTYLVANISKLKKIYKNKLITKIENLIF